VDTAEREIVSNGTVTFVETPQRILGITAAHVIRSYESAAADAAVRLQLGDAIIDDLPQRLIQISDTLDLATFALDQSVLTSIGRPAAPITLWPPKRPHEGYGIMLGGYPGQERDIDQPLNVTFGLFTALGIARMVSDDQITWLVERDFEVESASVPSMPSHYDLGGISGGPLITTIENPTNFVTFRLGGIISEAHAEFEYVIAKCGDLISADGTIAQS
tara:strand:+ start:204568 stop:205224 length:657 start_codon:yes stop_codon:yes gene_type:complete